MEIEAITDDWSEHTYHIVALLTQVMGQSELASKTGVILKNTHLYI